MEVSRDVRRIALTLGASVLMLYLGFFTHNFMAEPVIYSISIESNATDYHGGYYGQSLQLVSFGLFSLIAPILVYYLTAKIALSVSAVTFIIFFGGFLHFNHYYYYISQVLIGAGTALFYVAEGVYLTEVSPDESYGYVVSVETMISHSGQLVGGMIMFIISYTSTFVQEQKADSFDSDYIRVMYGAFTICSIIALFLFLCLTNKKADNEHNWAMLVFDTQFTSKCAFFERTYIVLKVMFMTPAMTMWGASLYQGAFGSFFLNVYPTTFMFDSRFDKPKYMIALYCSAIGIGVIIAGTIMTIMTKKHRDMALQYGFYLHVLCILVSFIFVVLFTPQWVFLGPTTTLSYFWIDGYLQTMFIGILVGMGDCFLTTFRTVVCQGATEHNASEMFAVTRWFQALAGGLTLFITPYLSVNTWISILITLIFISFFGVMRVTIDIANQEVRNNLNYIVKTIVVSTRNSPSLPCR